MRRLKTAGERENKRVCSFVVTVILVGVFLTPFAYAETAVLDFEQLATPGTGTSSILNFNEDGFTFQPQIGLLTYWRTDDRNFPGSTSLFFDILGGPSSYTKITREDGLSFELESIMLCEERIETTYAGALLTGIKLDDSIVEAPITLDGTFGFETFYFDEFNSFKELQLTTGPYQYDQLIFNVVPEPGTLALLASGTMILIGGKRKKIMRM